MTNIPNRVRGIRQSLPGGTVIGNPGAGGRPAQTIPIASLARALSNSGTVIAGGGTAPLLTVADKSILANISGASAAPTGHPLTALLDNIISGATGVILYRNATVWTALSKGSTNQVLAAGSTLPAYSDLSALLDAVFSSTQGSVLYRGASAWAALGPGTSGQFLQTQGASANPAWADMVSHGLFASTMTTAPTSAGTGLSTWLNQGSATVADVASGVQLTAPSVGSDQIRGRLLTAPATPYMATALVAIDCKPGVTGVQAGIGWYDGTNKLHILNLQSFAAGYRIDVERWSAPTTFVNNSDLALTAVIANPVGMRVSNDGTNLVFAVSSSYSSFATVATMAVGSGYLAAYTDLVFFINANGIDGVVTLLDWKIS